MSKHNTGNPLEGNRDTRKPRKVKLIGSGGQHVNQLGSGVGHGHGGNTPNLPVIREITDPATLARVLPGLEPGTRVYRMGKAAIFVSPPCRENDYYWHLSISRPDHYPSWDEVAKARYELLPLDREFAMILPRPEEYINIHQYCFQVHDTDPKRNAPTEPRCD